MTLFETCLCYLKSITNKDLLYSTESCVQYSVTTSVGKELENKFYIYLNCFALLESNAALLINCTPI